MPAIAHECQVLADSLWADTAHDAPDRPALAGQVTADFEPIGAGFTGLSAALHAVEAGLDVVILEAQRPGWGASGRTGGRVNPGLKNGRNALAQCRYGHRDGKGSRPVGLLRRTCQPRLSNRTRTPHSDSPVQAVRRRLDGCRLIVSSIAWGRAPTTRKTKYQ